MDGRADLRLRRRARVEGASSEATTPRPRVLQHYLFDVVRNDLTYRWTTEAENLVLLTGLRLFADPRTPP